MTPRGQASRRSGACGCSAPATSKAKGVVGKTLKVRLTKTACKVTAAAVTKVNAGNPVVVTGTVSPKTTGKVMLQVLQRRQVAHPGEPAAGRLRLLVQQVLPPKSYPLRVIKAFTSQSPPAAAKPVKVTVFPAPGTTPRPAVSPKLARELA